ncbi:MAG: DUF1461 domain-containing protein [Candidatus Aenigmarchaeota archaeon]|nr:DUF1461 domain-containing protein [Candidatus Aenigmarchaeota archaeon]
MKLQTFSKTVLFLAVLKGIFVLSLILSLVLWSIPILSLNSDVWRIFQQRSDVVLDENTTNYNELIVDFFRTGLKLEFLNEKEFRHMQDVRTVITIVNILFVFSFLSLVSGFSYLSKKQKQFLIKAVRRTSSFVFIITLLFSLVIFLNFNIAFLSFHKIFFVKNFIFPANSLLKTLYPDEFFFGLSAFYLLSVLIVSLVVLIISHKLKLK